MISTVAGQADLVDASPGRSTMLGLAVKPAAPGQVPRLLGVALTDGPEGAEVAETFTFGCHGDDRAAQLSRMSDRLGEWLSTREVSVAAIKGPSVTAPARRQAAAMIRAQMEGAVVAVLRLHGVETVMWGGASTLARLSGSPVNDVQRFALTFPSDLRDAAFAALTTLPAAVVWTTVPSRR